MSAQAGDYTHGLPEGMKVVYGPVSCQSAAEQEWPDDSRPHPALSGSDKWPA